MIRREDVPWIAALLVLLVVVGIVLVRSLPTAVYTAGADDSFYLFYAQRISEEGVSAFPSLYEWRSAVEARWQHPPPSRLGYVLPSALWVEWFGAEKHSLSTFSIAAHLATTLVAYALASRRRGAPFGFAFAVLIGFAPLLLGLGRLALMDSYTTLCSFLCVWAFLEWIELPRSNTRTVLFALALGWLVLTKELAVLVVAPLAVSLVLEQSLFRREVPWLRVVLAFVVPGVVVAGVLVLSAGGLAPLVATARTIVESPRTNAYTLAYCSGPWYRYVVDFMLLSPGVTLLGIGGIALAISNLRRGIAERFDTHVVALLLVSLFTHAFVMKNVRYATLFELPFRILALAFLVQLAPAKRTLTWVLLAVAILAFMDWRSFVDLWETRRGYDPVSGFLLTAREFLPAAPPPK